MDYRFIELHYNYWAHDMLLCFDIGLRYRCPHHFLINVDLLLKHIHIFQSTNKQQCLYVAFYFKCHFCFLNIYNFTFVNIFIEYIRRCNSMCDIIYIDLRSNEAEVIHIYISLCNNYSIFNTSIQEKETVFWARYLTKNRK